MIKKGKFGKLLALERIRKAWEMERDETIQILDKHSAKKLN